MSRWLDGVVAAGEDRPFEQVLAASAIALAGVLLDDDCAGRLVALAPRLLAGCPVDPALVQRLESSLSAGEDPSPVLLGQAHEALLAAHARPDRRRRGAVYTPPAAARGLVEAALEGSAWVDWDDGFTVYDPAAGGGAFLLAAADALCDRGLDAGDIVTRLLWGLDIDPLAAAMTEAALALWALLHGATAGPGDHVRDGDGLCVLPGGAAGFELVVGNPPFGSQLSADTARSSGRAAILRRRFGAAVKPYVDTAALFLAAGLNAARPGGRVSLVLPVSVLGARDASGVRAEAAQRATLVGLWVATEPVFTAASVRTCAPILELGVPAREAEEGGGQDPPPVRRLVGASVAPFDHVPVDWSSWHDGRSWARLAFGPFGVPEVRLDGSDTGVIGDVATATAGFRDEYYGLLPFLAEADADAEPPRLAGPAVVTAGLIDPMWCRWGQAPCRLGGRRWRAPAIDWDRFTASGSTRTVRWVTARRRPKLLVATQTRVLEAIVDADGVLVPSVPVISLEADAPQLWSLAAALHAPPVTAYALGMAAGTALSADAVKVAAAQVLALPLPVNRRSWIAATERLREADGCARQRNAHGWRASLEEFAADATVAYGLDADHPVVDWWCRRLPRPNRGAASAGRL